MTWKMERGNKLLSQNFVIKMNILRKTSYLLCMTQGNLPAGCISPSSSDGMEKPEAQIEPIR